MIVDANVQSYEAIANCGGLVLSGPWFPLG
jgi:hypothetical protein